MASPPLHRPPVDERRQLELFTSLPGPWAPRDAQDLMSWPFFSLAKSRRIAPIDFRMGHVWISVEAVPEHGMATIWDADVLIWAASQIVEALDAGRKPSRLMATSPHEILTFIGRGKGKTHYDRLKCALDRLQSTSVATSIRLPEGRRRHRFSWINEWRETSGSDGRVRGIELILPEWFYAGVLDRALVLTIDRAYFALTGGLERWLYRIVRKHGGHQRGGWSFDLAHLHAKSGALSPFKQFTFDIRSIVRRQALPGYELSLSRALGREQLHFVARPADPLLLAMRRMKRDPVDLGPASLAPSAHGPLADRPSGAAPLPLRPASGLTPTDVGDAAVGCVDNPVENPS